MSLLVLWISAGCGTQAGEAESRSRQIAGPRIKAPDFELKDLDGNKVKLQDLKGKVVFLDFWATWCPPCVVSAPEVDKISHEYTDKNVAVLSISLDDNPEAVRAFAARKKLTGRMLMAGSSGVEVHYHVNGIPTFYVIDQEGYFVASWSGYTPAMARAWRNELDNLIKS